MDTLKHVLRYVRKNISYLYKYAPRADMTVYSSIDCIKLLLTHPPLGTNRSSEYSIRRIVTSLVHESSFGNMLTALAMRRISLFSRSSVFIYNILSLLCVETRSTSTHCPNNCSLCKQKSLAQTYTAGLLALLSRITISHNR